MQLANTSFCFSCLTQDRTPHALYSAIKHHISAMPGQCRESGAGNRQTGCKVCGLNSTPMPWLSSTGSQTAPNRAGHTCVVSGSQSGGLVSVLGVVLEEILHSLGNQGWLISPLQGLQTWVHCKALCTPARKQASQALLRQLQGCWPTIPKGSNAVKPGWCTAESENCQLDKRKTHWRSGRHTVCHSAAVKLNRN